MPPAKLTPLDRARLRVERAERALRKLDTVPFYLPDTPHARAVSEARAAVHKAQRALSNLQRRLRTR